MIQITREVFNNIIDHAERDAPIEACGYLAGKDGIITESYSLTNIDNSPEHFSFDPAEQFGVVKKARSNGLQIIANYHSHPLTPARPSQEDIKLAYDPNISYVIVSLADGKKEVKSYSIKNSEIEIQEITVIDDINQI